MIINNNISALNTHRQMGVNQAGSQNSMEKLASGLRINRAGDDAAGLAISEKMRAQVRGLDQAARNSQDGISMIQTAEGALQETHSILQRMRELATQAANDTNVEVDRNEIQKEMNQLTSEINRIGNTTEFNTQKLINGDKKDNSTSAVATGAAATLDQSAASAPNRTLTIAVDGATGVAIEVSDTNFASADDLAADVQAKIDGSSLAGKVTVTNNDGKLEFTATSKGETSTLSIAGTADGTLGITDSAVTATGDAATTSGLQFQIGANENQSLTLEISDMRANALGLTGTGTTFTTATNVTDGTNADGVESALDVSSHENAANAITVINDAIERVSAERSMLGATQNRLEHTISNLNNSSENLQAAESRIRDVDMAREVMEMTKNNILSQASQAMLAQANQAPQAVLQLLG
ncbi:flagellin [Alkalihalophilus sp. As8PL]|uniref:Flagellin n=1 Tax=Alkalihalophilus sp. As8PL TaxID=3237103 RepID=A0AB39BQT6_9BACI